MKKSGEKLGHLKTAEKIYVLAHFINPENILDPVTLIFL